MTEPASPRGVLKRKPVVAWALYDWAIAAFATAIMAGLFPVFLLARSVKASATSSDLPCFFEPWVSAELPRW
jgi:MFS-type transporter involved in bile tolerance (Atg22 family)